MWPLVALLPFIWMWSSAFKSSREIFRDPFALPTAINVDNLIRAWTVGRFSNYIGNSIIITLPTVFGVLTFPAWLVTVLPVITSKDAMYLLPVSARDNGPFQSVMIPLYFNLRITACWGLMAR